MAETLSQFLSWTPPDRTEDIIADGILAPQTRLVIFGSPKTWKSGLALYTASVIANGTKWFGYVTKQALPLVYQVELPKYTFQKRGRKFFASEKFKQPNILFESAVRLKLDTSHGYSVMDKELREAAVKFPNQHIVLILDNVYKIMSGHISDPKDVERLLDNIDELKDKHKCSIILIHHSRLTKYNDQGNPIDAGAEDAMGSSYFDNWCDTMIKLKLLDPAPGLAVTVRADFVLTRNAEHYLPGFKLRWSRNTLHPTLIEKDETAVESEDDVSIRDLNYEQ